MQPFHSARKQYLPALQDLVQIFRSHTTVRAFQKNFPVPPRYSSCAADQLQPSFPRAWQQTFMRSSLTTLASPFRMAPLAGSSTTCHVNLASSFIQSTRTPVRRDKTGQFPAKSSIAVWQPNPVTNLKNVSMPAGSRTKSLSVISRQSQDASKGSFARR